MKNDYRTQRLDHLGIVAGICEEIDLIGQIDARVPDTGRTVSVGQAVQAMVLNGLGFVNRPLYLMPEFYANKPVERLIGAGIQAEALNGDSLGRALDHLYAAGVTELFAAVSAHALQVMGIDTRFAHLDTTAFSVEGAYEVEEMPSEGEPVPLKITYGYSKDHRPDLKQAVLGLICANASSIPVWLAALDGNRADKASLPAVAQAYLAQFQAEDEMPYLVADSALYSEANLQTLSAVQWVSRVPATLSQAKHLLQTVTQAQMQAAESEGYYYHEQRVTYADIEQRWLVVLYEPNRVRELEGLAKAVAQEHQQASRALKKLARHDFGCAADAQAAGTQLAATWKHHRLRSQITAHTRYAQPGRPGANSQAIQVWRIQGEIEPDDERLAAAREAAGKYLIATNELDADRLPTADLLTAYKDQNRSAERGFRFLKDPLFFASSFFLKKPARIMALLMIMGLSLLVYALAEHVVRSQLVERDATLPNQLGQPTQRPTMRRLFQLFEGIDVLYLSDCRQAMIMNLKPIHRQILLLFSPTIQKFYVSDG